MPQFVVVTDTQAITSPEGRTALFFSQTKGGKTDTVVKARRFGSIAAATGILLRRGTGTSGVVAVVADGVMSVVITMSTAEHMLEAVWQRSAAKTLLDQIETESH